jgi:hypothetical protein
MAYSTFSQSAKKTLAGQPHAGVFPLRPEPDSTPTIRRSDKSADAPETAITATSALLRFLILLVVISGLACLYVWQANTISSIRNETQAVSQKIRTVERQNVILMLEYAHFDTPGYIEAESSQAGMVTGQTPVRVQLPKWDEHQVVASQHGDPASPIRQLATWLPNSWAIWSEPK